MSQAKEHVTLQDYFVDQIIDGKTEFRVVAEDFGRAAGVKFYIHPLGKDGESRDFVVDGDETRDVTRFL